MVVNNEINEGIRHCIAAWWEANRKSRHLNQKNYDMQAFEQIKLLNLVKRYEGLQFHS
jgi:hypothetical protein